MNRPVSFCLRKPFLIAVSAALAMGLPLGAQAHALLVKAEPARRAVLTRAPHQVKLWFNEQIEPAYTRLTVVDATDKPVTAEKFTVPEKEPKLMVLPLPELKPGKYVVKFRVLSVDGHVVESSYDFELKEHATTK
ncbi:MAG: copper-binding protein [Betaproteobacteria bacterium HGW-Betaproteobacteria-11]|nr:MAG: copper-binding protein [Betaproteobacteria bacterium HGW-Betaproteobacteria-11]